ncbi:MAG: phage tail protein [Burkholderiaceae bacterium]|nr:phage tail protein [Burkholderiaceae bacterium]
MDPFVGEIKICAFSYAPQGWAKCDGSAMTIQQNAALYSLLGITYGGDGKTTFCLPDLRGRTPVHRNPAVANFQQGKSLGAETVALTAANLPQHSHTFNVTSAAGAKSSGLAPNASVLAATGANLYGAAATLTPMGAAACGSAGAGAAHANMQPSLALNFIIATSGLYPSRP